LGRAHVCNFHCVELASNCIEQTVSCYQVDIPVIGWRDHTWDKVLVAILRDDIAILLAQGRHSIGVSAIIDLCADSLQLVAASKFLGFVVIPVGSHEQDLDLHMGFGRDRHHALVTFKAD